MKRRRFITIITIVIALITSGTALSYGLESEALLPGDEVLLEDILVPDTTDFIPRANVSCVYSFKKTSGSEAKAVVQATKIGATKITSTVTLQYNTKNGYVDASADPAKQSVSGGKLNHSCTFKVSKDKKYRIKITIHCTYNGNTSPVTYYEALNTNGY